MGRSVVAAGIAAAGNWVAEDSMVVDIAGQDTAGADIVLVSFP